VSLLLLLMFMQSERETANKLMKWVN